MATIKLQPSGKVVLKDGKVACGCCETCCMYPAQGLVDAIYTADDLPDDVTVDGTSFPRSGTTYGNTTNGVIFEEDVWTKYTNGTRSERPCLIQGGVEDQFADSYTLAYIITDENIGSTTITRQSLCVWTGNAGGVPVRLEYEDTDFFRWFMITPETEIIKAEPAFQNTPTGFYETGNIEFTVS